MLILRIMFIIYASHVSSGAEFSFTKNANNYGPYNLIWKKYEMCQGPNTSNSTTIAAKLFTNDTVAFVTYNTTFRIPVRLNEIKIHVSHVNGIQKTTLWNYKVNKPCQHFAIASIIAKHYPLQQSTCIIKKGEFYFVVNFTAVAHQFFGDSFFYGEFEFKVNIQSNQGNIMCLLVNVAFNKKTQ